MTFDLIKSLTLPKYNILAWAHVRTTRAWPQTAASLSAAVTRAAFSATPEDQGS